MTEQRTEVWRKQGGEPKPEEYASFESYLRESSQKKRWIFGCKEVRFLLMRLDEARAELAEEQRQRHEGIGQI